MDPETYLLYLKGMYYWDKRTADGFQKAREYLNRAIDKDLTFALAYSALAGNYVILRLRTANSLTQTTQWTTLTVGKMAAGLSAARLGFTNQKRAKHKCKVSAACRIQKGATAKEAEIGLPPFHVDIPQN